MHVYAAAGCQHSARHDGGADDTRDTEGVYFRRWRNIRQLPQDTGTDTAAARSTDGLPRDFAMDVWIGSNVPTVTSILSNAPDNNEWSRTELTYWIMRTNFLSLSFINQHGLLENSISNKSKKILSLLKKTRRGQRNSPRTYVYGCKLFIQTSSTRGFRNCGQQLQLAMSFDSQNVNMLKTQFSVNVSMQTRRK